MSRSLVFRQQARQEFDAAGDWYEREQAGLGKAFLAEVDRLLKLISAIRVRFRKCSMEFARLW
jgi:hypothetical protein